MCKLYFCFVGKNFTQPKKGGLMPNKLTDIDVSMISLVASGANKKEVVYKSDASINWDKEIKIKKTDQEQGIVYGIVYSPDEEDSQGDIANAVEIQKASYKFMKSKTGSGVVDIEHDLKPREDAFVCESWIVKKEDPLFDDVGSWAVGIKLESNDLRNQVKKGKLKSFSMFGTANREEIKKQGTKPDKDSFLEDVTRIVKSLFKKEKDQLQKEDITKAIETAVKEVVKDYDKKVLELKKEIESLKKSNFEIETELKKSKQSTDVKKQNNSGVASGIL